MNHAHTVPPVAVPYTSASNAPDGEAGWQPGAPSGVCEPTVAVLGEMRSRLVRGGAHATKMANANAVANAALDINSPSIRFTQEIGSTTELNGLNAFDAC